VPGYNALVRGFVANTDFDWFSFLIERQPLEEVNFWQPSPGRPLAVLQPGTPFFFRLKSPHRKIAGFGLFSRREVAPATLAWDAFGEKNGAASREEMFARIERLRPQHDRDPHHRYAIGCLMIADPVFFGPDDFIEQPVDFPVHPQGPGKTYDLEQGEGRRVFDACLDRLRARRVPLAAEQQADWAALADAPRYGGPQLVRPRLGQGTFRVAVTQAYHGACAVSGEHSLPVLDVAHIQSYAQGGPHDVRNGLLLRTDIHRLFDRGYVTVTPDFRFEVSQRLREEFENGKTYYALQGNVIQLPDRVADRPDPDLLRWHNERVFERGAA
jgi:putative restriction endonuclease